MSDPKELPDDEYEWVEGCGMRHYEDNSYSTCMFAARSPTEEGVIEVIKRHRAVHLESEGWKSPPRGGWRTEKHTGSGFDYDD
ncbi:MAG: hypothetical protein AAB590_01535 [Patescibacteria group bacterium]